MPKDKESYVIVDSYSTHKHEMVRSWMQGNPRVVMYFILSSSLWLHLVERFLGVNAKKLVRRGLFLTVKDLEQKAIAFIELHNASPKSFVCTEKTETILEKI